MSTTVVNQDVSRVLDVINGGPGSGHHGHKGIPGQRGGSLPADGSAPRTSGGSASRAALIRMLAGPTPSTPGNQKRQAKNAYTKTSRTAELFSARAKQLEARKKKKFRVSKDELMDLRDVHREAARNLAAAAMQSTLIKGATKQEQLDRLERAAEHEALARRYHDKMQPSKVRAKLQGAAEKAGGALAQGAADYVLKQWLSLIHI